MTILIQGEVGAGKSTLIRRVLAGRPGPVYGFYTQKQYDRTGGFALYIRPAPGLRQCAEEQLVGVCRRGRQREARPEGFEQAAAWLETVPARGAVVLDELGVLESDAPRFQRAVLALLAPGDRLVLAAVKAAGTPFLDEVRAVPGAALYRIDRTNRDQIFAHIQRVLGDGNWT